MKKYLLFFAIAVSGSAWLTSCSDEETFVTDEEQYARDFVKVFGAIDANQDWNMVDRYSVTTSGSASDVAIYAKIDDAYKIVGHYTNVSGSQSLGFDAPKGCTEFYVEADNKKFFVGNGETIDLNTRTRSSLVASDDKVITAVSDYLTLNRDVQTAFADRLPAGSDNRSAEKVITNYDLLMPEGGITIYPIYWCAGYYHKVGIYWYDEDGDRQEQLFYADREGDELMVYATDPNGTDGYYSCALSSPSGTASTERYDCNNLPQGYELSTETKDFFKTKGFHVNLPKNTKFGLYMEVYTDKAGKNKLPSVYSNSTLNKDNTAMTAIFQSSTSDGVRTFIGFEDLYDGEYADHDLNDLIIMLNPSATIVDYEAQSYIIAAEDLGSTNDFDFNDVVFSVSYTSGGTKAKIHALAAGGTLPVQLYQDGNKVGGEWHSWFGDGTIPSSSVINTTSCDKDGIYKEIDVPIDFSLALNLPAKSSMGGFSLSVSDNDATHTIYGPSKTGEAPQMICVPSTWLWPIERTNISVAYPKFGEWGANYTVTGWSDSPVDGKVVTR